MISERAEKSFKSEKKIVRYRLSPPNSIGFPDPSRSFTKSLGTYEVKAERVFLSLRIDWDKSRISKIFDEIDKVIYI